MGIRESEGKGDNEVQPWRVEHYNNGVCVCVLLNQRCVLQSVTEREERGKRKQMGRMERKGIQRLIRKGFGVY